jgi:hypothetical protein
MTINDIALGLPNGFHDAEIKSWSVSWIDRSALIDLDVWTGESGADMETYQAGTLTLTGLHFWINEAPDERYEVNPSGPLVVDIGDVAELTTSPAVTLPSTPPSALVCWLYVRQWNSFIYLAADGASFTGGEQYTRSAPH